MEITVPTSWDDVTVNQYQALTQIKQDDYKSDLGYTTAVLQVLCDLDNMTELPLKAVSDLAPHISFLSELPTQGKYQTLEYNDINYEWINSFNAITVGEAISIELPIDLEELTVVLSYDVVLGVMLREEGKKFNSKEFNKNRVLFGGLPITQVLGQLLFFLNGGQTSTADTKTYSIQPMRTTISQRRNLTRWQRIKRKIKLISG
jgi:hypothetical protein